MNTKRIMMPYGKYKGRYIHELPSSYLLWIAENWSEDNPTDQFICMEADAEYEFRKKHNTLDLYEN